MHIIKESVITDFHCLKFHIFTPLKNPKYCYDKLLAELLILSTHGT